MDQDDRSDSKSGGHKSDKESSDQNPESRHLHQIQEDQHGLDSLEVLGEALSEPNDSNKEESSLVTIQPSSKRKTAFRRDSSGSSSASGPVSSSSRTLDEHASETHVPPTGPKPILKRSSNAAESDFASLHGASLGTSPGVSSSSSVAIVSNASGSGSTLPVVVDLSRPPPPSILKKRNSFEVRNTEIHPILKRHSIGGIGSSATMTTSPSSGSLTGVVQSAGSNSGSPFANTPEILDSPLSVSPSSSVPHQSIPGPALIALNIASGGALFDELADHESGDTGTNSETTTMHSILKNQSAASLPSDPSTSNNNNLSTNTAYTNQSHFTTSGSNGHSQSTSSHLANSQADSLSTNPSSSNTLVPKPILKKKVSVDEKPEKTIHFVTSVDIMNDPSDESDLNPASDEQLGRGASDQSSNLNPTAHGTGCISSASSGYASGDEISSSRSITMPKPILKKNRSTEDFSGDEAAGSLGAMSSSSSLSQPVVRPRRRSQDEDIKHYEVVEITPEVEEHLTSPRCRSDPPYNQYYGRRHSSTGTSASCSTPSHLSSSRAGNSSPRKSSLGSRGPSTQYKVRSRSQDWAEEYRVRRDENDKEIVEITITPVPRASSEGAAVEDIDDLSSNDSPPLSPRFTSSNRRGRGNGCHSPGSHSPRPPPIRERSKSDNSWERRSTSSSGRGSVLRAVTPLSAPPSRSVTDSNFTHAISSSSGAAHSSMSSGRAATTTPPAYVSGHTSPISVSPTRFKVVNIRQFLQQTTDAALSRSAAAAALSGQLPSAPTRPHSSPAHHHHPHPNPNHPSHHPNQPPISHYPVSVPVASGSSSSMPAGSRYVNPVARSPPPPSRHSTTPSPTELELDMDPDLPD